MILIDQKNPPLLIIGNQGMQTVLLESPGFPQTSTDPVSFYCRPDPFLGDGTPYLDPGPFPRGPGHRQKYYAQGVNRKRLPFTEKRINLLPAFQPLLCVKAKTCNNGLF